MKRLPKIKGRAIQTVALPRPNWRWQSEVGGKLQARRSSPILWDVCYTDEVPNNLPLTDKAVDSWDKRYIEGSGTGLGYNWFKGFSKADMLSIFSAARRGEVVFTRNRQGSIAYYQIKGRNRVLSIFNPDREHMVKPQTLAMLKMRKRKASHKSSPSVGKLR